MKEDEGGEREEEGQLWGVVDKEEEEIIAVLNIAMTCVRSSPEKRPTMKHVSDVFNSLVIPSV